MMVAALFACLGCHSAPAVQFPTAKAALTKLSSQTSCSRAVQGDAKLVVTAPFFKQSGQLLYKVQAPDRVRFDVYSSFGVTISTLTSDGDKFALFNLAEKSFYYGPARTCNIQRFTQVAVPPFALAELLRGRAPVLSHDEQGAKIRWAQPWFSPGYYVVELEGQHAATQRIELALPPEDWGKPLEKQRLRLISVRVEQDGSLMYEVELSGHTPARRAPNVLTPEEREMGIPALPPTGPECAAELPRSIALSVPGKSATLTIENTEVFHNPADVPGAFTQEQPQGVRSMFSDCQD